MLKGFIDGNFQCEFYTLIRPNQPGAVATNALNYKNSTLWTSLYKTLLQLAVSNIDAQKSWHLTIKYSTILVPRASRPRVLFIGLGIHGSGTFSYPEPFLRAVRRGALAKSITGYHKNMVRKQCPVLGLANQMPVRNMDLARAPRRTARKKGSGYENGSGSARKLAVGSNAHAWELIALFVRQITNLIQNF
jgi:hypothetical protein